MQPPGLVSGIYLAETKADLVAEIAALISVEDPGMSTGSTERKSLLSSANRMLGLGAPAGSTKPQLARHVVECAGFTWRANFESRGSTVTRAGLRAVRDALRLLLVEDGQQAIADITLERADSHD